MEPAVRPVALPVLLTFALLSALPAWAHYRWKDANGQVHASDLPPPPEVPEKNILQRPPRSQPPAVPVGSVASPATNSDAPAKPAGATPVRPASGPVDPELAARRRQAEADTKAKAGGDDERAATQRANNCQRAREQLANLDSGQRLARQNAQGERVVLDEATRRSDADTARRVITADCR